MTTGGNKQIFFKRQICTKCREQKHGSDTEWESELKLEQEQSKEKR